MRFPNNGESSGEGERSDFNMVDPDLTGLNVISDWDSNQISSSSAIVECLLLL